MRSKFKWIFTLLLAFTMQFSFAQEKTVTGTVTDGKLPLSGANVKNGSRGVQTDADGKFAIKANVGDVLTVTSIGFERQTIKVGSSNTYNFKMESTSKMLEDVVILGYDKTATKPKSTAASATVTSKNFENRPNVTFLQSLQGASPGLTVSTSSGSPGSAKIDLLVRGIGSINSSTDPLYVIDGVPANSMLFRNINSEDIESASVLRDAIATSIYGNRGANGVIVIKTKSGKFNSGVKFSFSSTIGFSELPKDKYNLANSQEAMRLEREINYGLGAGDNPYFTGLTGPLTDAQMAAYSTYDWRKHFFRTGVTQTQNIGITAGGENVNSYTSLSYTNQNGIVPTTDFQRFTLRSNLNGKNKNGKFTYGTNLTVAFSKRHQLDQETSTTINNNTVQNPLLGALTALPYYNPSMYPGTGQGLYDMIGSSFDYGTTAFVLQDILQEGNLPNRINELKILGNANASYQFAKNWTYSAKLGVDYNDSQRIFARAPWSYLAVVVRETSALPFGGLERQTTDRDFGFNAVNSVNYSKSINKHTFNFGVYTEYIKAHRSINQLQQNGLDLKTYSFGAGTGWTNVGATYASLRPTVSAAKSDAGNFSYFATAGYDYNDKFGVDAIIRRDASYRFVQDYRWGTFWSVGGRWNIDKESFMNNSIFNMLKLRGSYGTQGNQNIVGNVPGANPIYLGNNLVRDLVGSGTGYGNTGSYVLSQLANTDLHWEKQAMSNIGVDFELWNSRFTGTLDIYKRKTTDLFTNMNLSGIVGWGTSIAGNNGVLENRGVELALKYKIFKDNKDFKLAVFASGSHNKNELKDIEQTKTGDYILENGSKVYEYYVVPYVGVNPANGNLLFLDKNNNVTENVDDTDRRRTGKSDTPDYQGAFGFNADYKGFFMDTQFTFAKDIWRFDYAMLWLNNPNYIGDNNVSADLLNAWTPTNTNTDVPSLTATNFTNGTSFSDMWLKDASYIRLKNVSIGYNFNKKMLADTFIKSLKIFVQGENMHTWTKWKGFDPESGEDTNIGKFPSPKTYSFGINLEF